jgi:ABC-type dipeptide/oligopeptide/nickel transport system permease component
VPFLPGEWSERVIFVGPILLGIVVIGLVLGIVAIVGGVSALRRKSFGLSLAGAICALPSTILGILAIIFVSVSKREFEADD